MTGASRGFGRSVAEEFVRQVAPATPVDLVLVARSESGLRTAADAIDEMARGICTPDGAADVVIRTEALDLGDLDQLEAGLVGVFSRIGEFRRWVSQTKPTSSLGRLVSSGREMIVVNSGDAVVDDRKFAFK